MDEYSAQKQLTSTTLLQPTIEIDIARQFDTAKVDKLNEERMKTRGRYIPQEGYPLRLGNEAVLVCVALLDTDKLPLALGLGVMIVEMDAGVVVWAGGVDETSGKVEGGINVCAHEEERKVRRAMGSVESNIVGGGVLREAAVCRGGDKVTEYIDKQGQIYLWS